MAAQDKNQVTWRVVVHGEASPRQHVFDEGWLLDSRISDADIVRCDSAGTQDLSVADSISEFSHFPNPSMSILILVREKSAPDLEQSWDGEVASFIVSGSACFRVQEDKARRGLFHAHNLLDWALNNWSHGGVALNVSSGSDSIERGPTRVTCKTLLYNGVIPHKAPLFMSRPACERWATAAERGNIASVCFDEEVTDEHH